MMDVTELAKEFHDTYERLAPEYGYETREETKMFDPESPNGKLMIATCEHIGLWLYNKQMERMMTQTTESETVQ